MVCACSYCLNNVLDVSGSPSSQGQPQAHQPCPLTPHNTLEHTVDNRIHHNQKNGLAPQKETVTDKNHPRGQQAKIGVMGSHASAFSNVQVQRVGQAYCHDITRANKEVAYFHHTLQARQRGPIAAPGGRRSNSNSLELLALVDSGPGGFS